jgi:hypothetical protein
MGDLASRAGIVTPGAKRIPAWLLGLIIAVVVFVAVLLLGSAFGFGDDPVVDAIGATLG